jgi:hypothetical protein
MTIVRKKISSRFLQEYLETLATAHKFRFSNMRNWNLLSCYAELQYKLNGGGRCHLCRAAVRHVVPVNAERENGTVDTYTCLCTRCFEGERARSHKMVLQIGDARVEYTPLVYGHETGRETRHRIPSGMARAAAV